MKKTSVLLFLMLLYCVVIAQDTLYINQNTIVDTNETLEIEQNTVVLITGQYSIKVLGNIIAKGTAEQPIKFTSNFDPDDSEATSWRGIRFDSINNTPDADSSIFENCIFEHGYIYTDSDNSGEGGAVGIYNSSKIRFSNCLFQNNFADYIGGAISITGSNVILDKCTFANNITDSYTEGYGGAIATINSAFVMKNCVIDNNYSSSIGGGMVCMDCNESSIINTEFRNNSGTTGGGAFISGCDDMLFVNNLFHNNIGRYFGGGFAVKNSNFRIINCTVADNFGGQGGGIYCSSQVLLNFYNTILSKNKTAGNGPEIYFAFLESTFNLISCVVDGGKELFGGSGGGISFHGIYNQIIEEGIEFEKIGNYDYHLPDNSPCIDAGEMKVAEFLPELDIADNKRINNKIIDIGAFENQSLVSINQYNHEIAVYPNPAKDYIIFSTNNENEFGKYYIFNSVGQVVKSINIKNTETKINTSHLSEGLYFIRKNNSEGIKFIIE